MDRDAVALNAIIKPGPSDDEHTPDTDDIAEALAALWNAMRTPVAQRGDPSLTDGADHGATPGRP